jgi:hypothetical protein
MDGARLAAVSAMMANAERASVQLQGCISFADRKRMMACKALKELAL